MKTKKILLLALAAALVLPMTACYEKFDLPAPPHMYSDAEIGEMGYRIATIGEVKKYFSEGSGRLENYLGESVEKGDPRMADTYDYFYSIGEKVAIKGKVVSNDFFGNIYNSLFIQDTESGIEIKTGVGGTYSVWPPGSTVWVLCDGLVLGNYRSMLSLGLRPQAKDKNDKGTYYANRGMTTAIVDRHVLLGMKDDLTGAGEAVDITSVTDEWLYDHAGMLVRFKKLKSVWEDRKDARNPGYPQFMYKFGTSTYGSFNFTEVIDLWRTFRKGGSDLPMATVIERPEQMIPEPQNNYIYKESPGPSWGFKEHQNEFRIRDRIAIQNNYGSAKFDLPGYSGEAKDILIRTSGYARFALDPVTPKDKSIDAVGILQRYTSADKDDRTGRGRYPAWQIIVNNVTDITPLD